MVRFFSPPLTVSRDLSQNLEAILEKEVVGDDARQKLGELLQAALQLEFATIAPYLSAAFSLNDQNEVIQKLIFRVAKEEMLHMIAVANLMNAIGTSPDIVGAVPEYPFYLNSLEPPLLLELNSFSLGLVESLFRTIEAPEDPVDFPSELESFAAERPRTIGQFYKGIIRLIENDTIPDLFTNTERDSYKQVEVPLRFDQSQDKINYLNDQENRKYPLSAEIDLLIEDKESAIRHLAWIVSEGEGGDKFNPLGPEGIPGHYYRFESILESKYLIRDETSELGYSYSGGSLIFSQEGVHEFEANAKVEQFAAWQDVETQMNRFNQKYTEMVDGLQVAFNCPDPAQKPEAVAAYDAAISAMRAMTRIAGRIIVNANEAMIKAGVPFQYKPSGPTPV